MNNQSPYILENGEQFDLTPAQARFLVKQGLIYDSGEHYFHLCDGVEYINIELALKGVSL